MYYAEYCAYGTRVSNGRMLRRFRTKSERDEWVEADVCANDWHREAITREDAARKYPNAFRRQRYAGGPYWHHYTSYDVWGEAC